MSLENNESFDQRLEPDIDNSNFVPSLIFNSNITVPNNSRGVSNLSRDISVPSRINNDLNPDGNF